MNDEIKETGKTYSEDKAAEMVEKRCRNCIYSKCNLSSFCVICSDKSKFTPSRASIAAKIEEFRNQTAIKQDSSSKLEAKKNKYGRLNGLIYCCIYGELQRIAWENGYTLAVHGSMDRDFDVVAIPWTEAAISAEDLIIKFHCGIKAEFESEPEDKPHGRKAWVLGVGSGLGIDVSVMPRIEKTN